MQVKRPIGRNNLDKQLHRLFPSDAEYLEMRSMMANVIVGQFLPPGVVKGGSSLKLRFGYRETRVTTDFDAAARHDRERFIEELQKNLSAGWEGFSFEVVRLPPAKPKTIPPSYVMHPFSVKVNYCGKAWCTVDLELGHNEVGDADEAEWFESPEVNRAFKALGFPSPGKIPVMPLKHQVAQKLHGLSGPGSERVHDLVDLQLIFRRGTVDLGEGRAVCERLFAYRKMQAWPPKVVKGRDWDSLYTVRSAGLDVMPLDEAIAWANDLVARIAETGE